MIPPTFGRVPRSQSIFVVLDQLVEVPAVAPFLPGGQRHADLLAEDRQVLVERLGADRVFHEERLDVLDHFARANGVAEVEPLVKIDAPVAVLADAFAGLLAVSSSLWTRSRTLNGPLTGNRLLHSERAIPCGNRERRPLFDAHTRLHAGNRSGRVVALAIIADHAAQNGVDRQSEGFAPISHSARSSAPSACTFSRPGG